MASTLLSRALSDDLFIISYAGGTFNKYELISPGYGSGFIICYIVMP